MKSLYEKTFKPEDWKPMKTKLSINNYRKIKEALYAGKVCKTKASDGNRGTSS